MAIDIEKIEFGDSGEKARNIIYNNDKRIVDNVYEKSETYKKTEVDSLLSDNKSYTDTELGKKADKDSAYNKTEVDSLLSNNKSYTDTELAKKADKTNTYNKTEVDYLVSTTSLGMIRKGEVATVADLKNISNPQKGWSYLVTADGYLYQYDGSVWNNTGIKSSNFDIEQQTGQNINTVMSQKSVTDELSKKLSLTGGTVTGDLQVNGRTAIGGALSAASGTITNEFRVNGRLVGGSTVYGQTTGYTTNKAAFEAKGDGVTNTISPCIAFNQPNLMHAEILLKGTSNNNSKFNFIRNGVEDSYADIQAGNITATSATVKGNLQASGALSATSGTITNDFRVNGRLIGGGTVYGQTTGYTTNKAAFEAKGDGVTNTISPCIAFNQPDLMHAEVLLKGTSNANSTFHFIRTGLENSFADIQAGTITANKFKVNGGTADQILMADGSVNTKTDDQTIISSDTLVTSRCLNNFISLGIIEVNDLKAGYSSTFDQSGLKAWDYTNTFKKGELKDYELILGYVDPDLRVSLEFKTDNEYSDWIRVSIDNKSLNRTISQRIPFLLIKRNLVWNGEKINY